MMERWWRQYTSAAKSQLRTGDYPPVVETYLTSMLSRRLLLNPDKVVSSKKSSLESELLRLVFNVESLRMDTMRDKILSPQSRVASDAFLLPAELEWPRITTRVEAAEGSIEQIAEYVPSDWLYVRFGSFSNYLWLTEPYGAKWRRP